MNKTFNIGLLAVTSIILLLSVWVGSLENNAYIAITFPILMAYLSLVIARRVFFTWEAFKNKKNSKSLKQTGLPKKCPKVSVVVPCYNEAKVIGQTINSLRRLNYPNFEVIIVDDGSTDGTAKVALRAIMEKAPSSVNFTVISKDNGGKASALNEGIARATGDYILCVDGDSKLHKDTLLAGIRHFDNPKVGAVAGFVEVENQDNLLLKAQEYEYLIGLNLVRRALSNYGIVPVIPGPVGLFRKSVLQQVKGFIANKNLMAEDAELSLRIAAAGFDVVSEEEMIAYTEAPADLYSLLRQRYRWNRGIFQALALNARSLVKSGKRGTTLASYLFFETYAVLAMNLAMVVTFLTHLAIHGQFQLLDKWFLGLIISEAITAIMVTFKHRSYLKWLGIALLSQFTYNGILIFWRMFALADEWLGAGVTWDKLDRIGTKEV
jgi:cellulose synthase/poly-beta-1,6-N-acetylglucosamine synthase-like glycosyltransferase